MASLQGEGRNELMDINGCGFDRGSGKGERERARAMEKMKRPKITDKMSQMNGRRDGGLTEERS